MAKLKHVDEEDTCDGVAIRDSIGREQIPCSSKGVEFFYPFTVSQQDKMSCCETDSYLSTNPKL